MNPTESSARRTAVPLAVVGWVAVGVLLLNVSVAVGTGFPAPEAQAEGWRWFAQGLGRALVPALPTLFLVGALVDFARFFGRVGEGDVFTERNVGTLRSGGEGLVLAAFASAAISPTLAAWIGEDGFRGLVWELNDLALGVAAMGFAMVGLAHIFRDAVRIKLEHDEIV